MWQPTATTTKNIEFSKTLHKILELFVPYKETKDIFFSPENLSKKLL